MTYLRTSILLGISGKRYKVMTHVSTLNMAEIKRDKAGKFIKGSIPWHKGKKGVYSPESLEKFSAAKRGKTNWRKGVVGKYRHSEEWKRQASIRTMGHPTSDETKRKISAAKKGEKHHNWKGGIWTGVSRHQKLGFVYTKFRREVIKRDKCCTTCGSTERLEVDHIKPYALFPELVMEMSNVRVLCHSCHKQTPTYGSNHKNYIEHE